MEKEIKDNEGLNNKKQNSVAQEVKDLEERLSKNEETSAEDFEGINDDVKGLIEDYEIRLKESADKFLRLQADFENYRKRVVKEKEEFRLYCLEDMIFQLLPVIDNFDRAISSFKSGDLDTKYIEGLEMVYNIFLDILNKNGLTQIEAENCVFDPNYHHAVMQEETEKDDNVIKEVFQKGYMLNSKVIRPCMVKVAVKN